ncbi:protein of unknown function [Aminobacter niigataensis]|nr:protein of unknown function [Aminobacter niigataensis]
MSQLLLRQPPFPAQPLQIQTEYLAKVHRVNLPNVHYNATHYSAHFR